MILSTNPPIKIAVPKKSIASVPNPKFKLNISVGKPTLELLDDLYFYSELRLNQKVLILLPAMSDLQYTCILWTDEDQYSVIPTSDISGNVKEGDVGTVAWRIVGKGRKITTEWYKAKILR